MKKYASIFCLFFSLLFAIQVNAYAAESKDTTLQYTVGSSYTVTIPDYIEANTEGQSISISDAIIPFGYEVDITADFDGLLKLKDFPSIMLPYTLYVNNLEISTNESVLKQSAGQTEDNTAVISAKVNGVPNYAGVYTSTVTFNVELKEIVQTDYTAKEIENDDHLFGIGLTKPEYVVAHFSDDFSTVTVTKTAIIVTEKCGHSQQGNRPSRLTQKHYQP